MPDNKYCYPGTDVLINKLGIRDNESLFEAEKKLTFIRLQQLQSEPIKGKYDFKHLKAIHQYIFQDIYDWAGKERTVEIGKGNLFCTTACLQGYAESIFKKYFQQCYAAKGDIEKFIKVFAENYGDLNALHPFREGNGRTQREFARIVCLECGYDFKLTKTTHKEMLEASKLSFDHGDNSSFERIFSEAILPHSDENDINVLNILTSDDLSIGTGDTQNYYGYEEYQKSEKYDEIYREKIEKMDEKVNPKKVNIKDMIKNNKAKMSDYSREKNKNKTRDDLTI